MPFVSQMFGLVMEAESSAGSALAFGCGCSIWEGRQAALAGLAPGGELGRPHVQAPERTASAGDSRA